VVEDGEQKKALEEYREIERLNFLDAKDIDNRRNAFMLGYGIEVHSFDAQTKQIKIKNYPSNEWAIFRDSDDKIKVAIRWVVLPTNSVYKNTILTEDLELISVYTDYGYINIEKQGDSWNIVGTESGRHYYGRVPVVQWRVDEMCAGIVSDAMISQNDEYNVVDSANGDSTKIDVDSLLKLVGVDGDWAKSNEKTIRQSRLIPLPEGADASYLTRTFDTERIKDRLDRTRKHIHIMGKVPDVENVIGATGATSGIALKLLFSPMQRKSESSIAFLKQGVVDRIELINAMWAKMSMPIMVDYSIVIQFIVPVNRIEEWANINGLQGIVSKKTMLEFLTDVDDPEEELKQLEEENAGNNVLGKSALDTEDPMEQEKIGEAKQIEMDQKSVDYKEIVGEVVENISSTVVDFMIQSGAVDRIIKADKNGNK
jgi:SPP1 family phage portal protein